LFFVLLTIIDQKLRVFVLKSEVVPQIKYACLF